MSNLGELIQLYGLDNLPDNLRKEREIQRWRDIMAQQKYEQDYLDGFLDAEAKARESNIDKETFFRHKQAMALRWFKYYRLCKDSKKRQTLVQQYNTIATLRQR